MKRLSIIFLLSLFIGLVNFSYAQDKHHSLKHHDHSLTEKIPNLTDAQSKEIKTLRVAHQKDVQKIKNQMDIKRAELKALQTEDKPDMSAINKKIEERSVLRTDLEKKRAQYKQDVRALLTDEQKLAFDKALLQKHEHPRHYPQHPHKCKKQHHKGVESDCAKKSDCTKKAYCSKKSDCAKKCPR